MEGRMKVSDAQVWKESLKVEIEANMGLLRSLVGNPRLQCSDENEWNAVGNESRGVYRFLWMRVNQLNTALSMIEEALEGVEIPLDADQLREVLS
jgi:hypothetical protein